MKFLLFGILQGLTEFLPVSSSGHLFLLKRLMGISANLLPFFVFLHIGTLLAIVIFFRKDIASSLLNPKILPHVLVVTAITASIGIILKIFVLPGFDHLKYLISLTFLINAVVLLKTKDFTGNRERLSLNFRDSLILGVFQGFSVLPGISRSGATISSLLKRGFSSREAFALSFLFGLPAILAAFALEAKELFSLSMGMGNIFLGFTAAFIFGILSLALLKKVVALGKIHLFGFYSLIVCMVSLFV